MGAFRIFSRFAELLDVNVTRPAIAWLRLNTDGTVTERTASQTRTDLGLGTLATQDGTFSGTSSGTNTGDITIGTLGSTPDAKGATISGQVLTFQLADATHPGLMGTGAQTFGGVKTWSAGATFNGNVTTNAALTIQGDVDFSSALSFAFGSNKAAFRTALDLTSLSTTTPGTGVQTALGVNIGSAGAPVLLNGAGGTPSSIVLTNATGTATALNIGGNAATATTAAGLNGTAMSGLATGILKNTTGTGVPSIAVAADFPTLNQNTSGTAAGLALSGGGTITGASGAITLAAGGTNQGIVLAPSGTGEVGANCKLLSVFGSTSSVIYAFSAQRTGTDLVYCGVNKGTTTGSIPANAVGMWSYQSSSNIFIGRGDSAGNPSNADIMIHGSSGNILVGTATNPSRGKLHVAGAISTTGALSVDGTTTATGGLILPPDAQTATTAAVSIATPVTKLTTTAPAQAITLANGTEGQIKVITHVATSGGGTAVLTPTTKTGYTTITFTAVTDTVTLQYYTTIGWVILSIRGAVAA